MEQFCSMKQGLGIALVAAQRAQVPVTLVDTSQASIDKGLKFAGMRKLVNGYIQVLTIFCRQAFGEGHCQREDIKGRG